MPAGVGAIDLMIGIPGDREEDYRHFPGARPGDDGVKLVLEQMDRYGIERGMLGVDFGNEVAKRALREHPDRFFASYEVNPNRGMAEVRKLVALHETFGIKAATAFPAGCLPQVPIDDKRFYPLYAKCVELRIPICVCCGVPGPRVPMACQDVALVDELEFVICHGAEPWCDLAVMLMLKWPNLYYMTSALAPKHYPKAIVDYANTRGADKVMYAGYFPMGLSLGRIFAELPDVPFRDPVWPKFLRENALRVFDLQGLPRPRPSRDNRAPEAGGART
jgi:hypothetical protein